VKDAILAHRVLVGMNQEMVVHAKGRPPKKVREKDGETDTKNGFTESRRKMWISSA